jgi:hypothetical protein
MLASEFSGAPKVASVRPIVKITEVERNARHTKSVASQRRCLLWSANAVELSGADWVEIARYLMATLFRKPIRYGSGFNTTD